MSSTKIENIDEVYDLTEEERLLIEEGIASAERGELVDGELVFEWMRSWGTENEKALRAKIDAQIEDLKKG